MIISADTEDQFYLNWVYSLFNKLGLGPRQSTSVAIVSIGCLPGLLALQFAVIRIKDTGGYVN